MDANSAEMESVYCNNDYANRPLAAAESVYLLASSEQHKPSDDVQTQRKQLKQANERRAGIEGLRFRLQSPALGLPLLLLLLQRTALM